MLDHFAVKLDDLSLIDLVADAEVRTFLISANEKLENGMLSECAEELSKARSTLFRKLSIYVPAVDGNLKSLDRALGSIGLRGVSPFAYLVQYLNSLREATLVALLRLPVDDYRLLQRALPSVDKTFDGKWHVSHSVRKYSVEECRRLSACIVNLSARVHQLV